MHVVNSALKGVDEKKLGCANGAEGNGSGVHAGRGEYGFERARRGDVRHDLQRALVDAIGSCAEALEGGPSS